MHKTYQFDSNQKPKIKDLCQEDKKKIGKLIKRLAQEREEKEILLKKLADMQSSEQKQQRLQTEIEKLDEEISQLQDQEKQTNYQTPQLQTQSKQKLLYKFENDDENLQNLHQSPNFKVLNQINEDQSSSFIMPITQRESPIKVDQQIQTSILQQQIQQQPTGQQKKSSKKKKEILMKKIQEFEKIVNRLNFSNEQSIELTTNRKSEDQNSQLNNTSYLQNVFQKLLNIEQQSITTQQTVRSEQQSEIQQVQFQQQQYNEDDLIIQLLNSDASSYKPQNQNVFNNLSNVSKQQQKKQQQSKNNSTILQNENKQNKQKITFDQIPSPIVQDAYCKNVVQKYNSLLQELNRQQ
ncbi:unnamed protein product [Paramecium sonneborni]|uniref:Uncharacterized protein n=1 Tax=Paramecium sonneborni TaxID=65129 RepID=A0A8S1N9M9_9CILI|nr:unnamed protein product [Paramecium sonneborni]